VPLPAASLVQLLLPMVTGIVSTRQELMSWVHDRGLDALDELFRADAEALAGPKGKHRDGRMHNHWGTGRSELPFGGQRIVVERPRVRTTDGREAKLPTVEAFREIDPLPERVVERIVLGVSSRTRRLTPSRRPHSGDDRRADAAGEASCPRIQRASDLLARI
jgi:hypothetical protein